jgi:hypothetical protein
MSRTTLVYSQQCTNCARFIDALKRTSAASAVTLVDVAQLTPQQLAGVQAVPALVTSQGQTLYGTKAFEWLKQYEADVELEGFAAAGGSLAFSDVGSMGYATFATEFSAFEPVK